MRTFIQSNPACVTRQLTRQSYELIKDRFVCEPRGTLAVKGKGEMETWYLVAERTPGAP
jgi:hypothetical protein